MNRSQHIPQNPRPYSYPDYFGCCQRIKKGIVSDLILCFISCCLLSSLSSHFQLESSEKLSILQHRVTLNSIRISYPEHPAAPETDYTIWELALKDFHKTRNYHGHFIIMAKTELHRWKLLKIVNNMWVVCNPAIIGPFIWTRAKTFPKNSKFLMISLEMTGSSLFLDVAHRSV